MSKGKWVALGFLLPLCAVGAVFLSSVFVLVMGKTWTGTEQLSWEICVGRLRENPEAMKMVLVTFLMLAVLVAMLVMMTGSDKTTYKSELRTITDKIATPLPYGEKQHGSAQWMSKYEYLKEFGGATLALKSGLVAELLKRGADDLKEEGGIAVDADGKAEAKPPAPKNKDTATTPEEPQAHKPLLKSGGILLGQEKRGNKQQLYYIANDTHTLCIGATRSGKSRCIVLPSIGVQALAGENIVVSDPKGELYQFTSPFLRRLGYEVLTLDFKNPLRSSRYNFLQNVIDAVNAKDNPKASDAAWDITSSLMNDAKNTDPIWTNGEAAVIAACILAVVYDNQNEPQYQNMTNVYYFLANMTKANGKKLPMTEFMAKLPDDHPAKALMAIAEIAPEKTRGSFFTSALTTLRLFTSPLIYSMTCTSDFDLSDTARKRALFMILPDEKTTYYSLASLFVNQFYEILVRNADLRGGRLERRINFNLDEFGNFSKIPSFANKLTVAGGRGCRFNLFVQAIAQLDDVYGKEVSKTIQGNCQNWLYLQSDDLETLEVISKKLGNYTCMAGSQSSSSGQSSSSSSSYSLMSRSLLTTDEVKLIARPYTLVTSRGHPAMMKAPDISKTPFNALFGMGDEEHNRKLRESRENRRAQRSAEEMKLWGIWKEYDCSMQKATDYRKP